MSENAGVDADVETEADADADAATSQRRPPLASPWPVFVALGLPVAELGILFDVFPVAVGGLLLFAGSVSGLLGESGYATSPWRALAGFGVLFLVTGGLVVLGTDFVARGWAILVAAGVLLAGGVAGELFGGDDPVI